MGSGRGWSWAMGGPGDDADDGAVENGVGGDGFAAEGVGGVAEAVQFVERGAGIASVGADHFGVEFDEEDGGEGLQRGAGAAKDGGFVALDIDLDVGWRAELANQEVDGGGVRGGELLAGAPFFGELEVASGKDAGVEHRESGVRIADGRLQDANAVEEVIEGSLDGDHFRGGGGGVDGYSGAAKLRGYEAEDAVVSANIEKQHAAAAMRDEAAKLVALLGVGDLAL